MVKNGEKRRIESIARRHNELNERRQLINQSLSGELKLSKRTKFADFAEEEPAEENAVNNKPFSFLASIGRVYPQQNGNHQSTKSAEKEAAPSNIIPSRPTDLTEESTPKLRNLISLYKPPNGSGAQKQCSFFVNEHTPEIRSSFTSFRRHKKEETLRKEWDKLRIPIVKFYKKERKSALRHLRKGIEKGRTKQKEQDDG